MVKLWLSRLELNHEISYLCRRDSLSGIFYARTKVHLVSKQQL